MNVLFYSNRCEASKHLISLMQTEKLIKYFHLVCTDNTKVPANITVTPTIIIKGIPIPYVAVDAFAWFAKIKQWKLNVDLQRINNEQQKYLQNINNNLMTTTPQPNLFGFNQAELTAVSDMFSHYTKDLEHDNTEALPQSYFPCTMVGKDTINTVPLEDGTFKVKSTATYKISKEKAKELQKNLEAERKKQDAQFSQAINQFRKQYDRN